MKPFSCNPITYKSLKIQFMKSAQIVLQAQVSIQVTLRCDCVFSKHSVPGV